MTPFLVGFIVGVSVAALLTIVLAPSRRVRSEAALPRDSVTRILLGQNPDEPTSPQPAVSDESHRAYDAKELQALRNLGPERQTARRRR